MNTLILVSILLVFITVSFSRFPYIYLILFLLLGDSYTGKNEMLFGILNLGKQEYRLMGGFTLYAKDIIALGGVLSIFFNRIISFTNKFNFRNNYFINFIKIIVAITLLNLLFKLILFQDVLEPRSFRVLLRNFGPLLMYFAVVQWFEIKHFKKFLFLSITILILNSILYILNYNKLSFVVDQYMLTMGSLVILRLEIPHGFGLWVPYFLSLGILMNKKNFLEKIIKDKKEEFILVLISILSVIFLLAASLVSTYRTYALVILISIIFLLLFRFSRIDSFALVLVSFLSVFIILILNLLSELLRWDIIQIGFDRIISSYYDLKYGQGTALARFDIIAAMIEKYLSSPRFLLFGTQYTNSFLDYFSSNNDIGIFATITQSGIFILIPIIYLYIKVFKLFYYKTESGVVSLIKYSVLFYFLSILPSFLFNYNIINEIFHSQVVFTLLGLFDAFHKRSLENNKNFNFAKT